MSVLFYVLLGVVAIGLGLFIIFMTLYRGKVRSTSYSEGLRNENDGHYKLALQNYEDALGEMRKLNGNYQLRKKIARKIKTLHTTIEYEDNFHESGKGDRIPT